MKMIFQISILVALAIGMQISQAPVQAQTREPVAQNEPFDPELEKLIDEYKLKKAYGNASEATALYQQIMEIGKHAYPERLQELNKLLHGDKEQQEQSEQVAGKASSSKAPDDPNRRWYFIQSDKALQYSLSLARQEGNIAYLQIHARINKQDRIWCDDPTCLGYIWYFTYRTPNDEKREYHFYIANSYEGIYTPDMLIPFEIKTYPDGSRQTFSENKDFIVYYLAGSSEEYLSRKFYNCVDDKLSNYAGHRCRDFKVEMATVVK